MLTHRSAREGRQLLSQSRFPEESPFVRDRVHGPGRPDFRQRPVLLTHVVPHETRPVHAEGQPHQLHTRGRSQSDVRVQDPPGGGAAGGAVVADQREEGQRSEGQTPGQDHRPSPRDADAAGGRQVSGPVKGLPLQTLHQENIEVLPRETTRGLHSVRFPEL